MMPQRLRKLTLLLHITCSIGWMGAIAVFLALAIAGYSHLDEQMVRAAYLAMEHTALYVIVPLSLGSLVSGIIQSLGTQWGLFKHYWVIIKLLLTVFAVVILLLQLEPIRHIAEEASKATFSRSDLRGARLSLIVHAVGGLEVLLANMILSVYKPRGVTRYGWRKQREQAEKTQT